MKSLTDNQRTIVAAMAAVGVTAASIVATTLPTGPKRVSLTTKSAPKPASLVSVQPTITSVPDAPTTTVAPAAVTTTNPVRAVANPSRSRHKPRSTTTTTSTSVVVDATTTPTSPAPLPDQTEESSDFLNAEASWYGPGFYGNGTACGQRYTREILGVAHKTLPCGTMVTFRHNGSEVTVPVIDRGPYTRGRMWDLSHATCQRLGRCFTANIEYRIGG